MSDDERTQSTTIRREVNFHMLDLDGCNWRCLICGHWFDAASDARLFACGDDCTGKHARDRIRATR